jgi:hypothetical protein
MMAMATFVISLRPTPDLDQTADLPRVRLVCRPDSSRRRAGASLRPRLQSQSGETLCEFNTAYPAGHPYVLLGFQEKQEWAPNPDFSRGYFPLCEDCPERPV